MLVYSSEREGVFNGVEVRYRAIIVLEMDGWCDGKTSNRHKKITLEWKTNYLLDCLVRCSMCSTNFLNRMKVNGSVYRLMYRCDDGVN